MSHDLDYSVHGFAYKIQDASSYQEWVRWFYFLVLLTAGIAGASLYGYVDKAIYITMGVLIVFAFYSSFKDVSTLHQEIRAASRQMKLLIDTDDIEEFLDSTGKNRDYSYFRSHIASLYQIYSHSPEIHQDTLIEILNSKLLAKNRKVELFSSILITVGLIGTIVGLIFMMTQLSEDIMANTGGGDIMTTLVSEGGALSGLGIAFYTTLIGALFGGVILRILTSIVEEGITKYVALLAELTEVNVLPILRSHAAQK